VAGRDPADLIERGAEGGADVTERDVDDRDVDERHQRGPHHDQRDEQLRACDLTWHRRSPGGRSVDQFWMVTVTAALMPGRRATSGRRSRRTSTGTRCTTFVKLPEALSGGSSEKRDPVPAAKLSTCPAKRRAPKVSMRTSAGWPARIWPIWS